jgi:hypothetical protein
MIRFWSDARSNIGLDISHSRSSDIEPDLINLE